MMRAKKSLGQHFLIDRRAIERIVGAVPPGSTVLEIGPGRGALTLPLCARAAKVVAVEKDDVLAAWWQTHAPKNLTLVHGDALEFLPELLDAHAPDAIVGNLPYNISGPLTALLVEHARAPMVLMYQQEVAERICAKPGARAYGRLTALVAYRWRAELWFRLPPEAFRPRPKVRSAVVRFRPADPLDAPFAAYAQALRLGFRFPRKTIANNLKGLLAPEALIEAGIAPEARPATLTPEDWAKVARLLEKRALRD